MSDDYSASSIQVLDSLESVRKRPGMYIGDVSDGSGLRQMIWEIVGNVIDQHLGGHARAMRVEVEDGWILVEDDGAGIPLDLVPTTGAQRSK